MAAVLTPLSSQGGDAADRHRREDSLHCSGARVAVRFMTPGAYMLSGGTLAVLRAGRDCGQDGIKSSPVLIGDSGDAATSVRPWPPRSSKQAGVELRWSSSRSPSADPTPEITAGLADKPGAVTVLGDTRLCVSSMKVLQSVAPDVKKPHRQLPGQAGLGCHRWSGQVDRRRCLHFGEPVVRRPVGHPIPQHHGQYAPDDDPQGLGYLGYQVVMALGASARTSRVSPPMICVPRSPPPGTCRFRRLRA